MPPAACRTRRWAHASGLRHRHRGLDLAPAYGAPVKDPGADRALSALAADDEPTAVSGVIETLYSGLGDDSALVGVIIEQMEVLTGQR
jgi:hypothetical protein